MPASYAPRLTTLALLAVSACARGDAPEAAEDTAPRPPPTTAAEEFLASLQGLCGQAFAGQLLEINPPDDALVGQELVIHVRECTPDVVRIPFHVGEDRSRTWVVTATDDGLRLAHDHVHEDGTPDAVTGYGGPSTATGTRTRQDFPADEHTATLAPEAASNVWTLEIRGGRTLVYGLRREEGSRRVRIEFDLRRPVEQPPPPWGSG